MRYSITLQPDILSAKKIYDWRYELKRGLLEKRGYRSDWSGKPFRDILDCEMHEGIISRAMVPKNLYWHMLIFAEPNCFLLFHDEHIPKPPSREWCIQKAIEYYGHDVVKDWYDSLPFKVKPFKLL